MNTEEVKERIEEYRRIRKNSVSDQATLAEAALFVEEVFNIILSDREISPDNLGGINAIEQFVLKKMELHR